MKLRFSILSLLLLAAMVAIPIADRVAQIRGRDRILSYLTRNTLCQASINYLNSDSRHIESFASEGNIAHPRSFNGAITATNQSLFQKLQTEQNFGIEQLVIRVANNDEAVEWSGLLSEFRALRGLRVLAFDLKDPNYSFDITTLSKLDDVKFLRLSNFSIHRALIKCLTHMNDLESLDISGCSEVDFDELPQLVNCSNLAWLRVDCKKLTDLQIQALRDALPKVYLTIE